MGGISLKYPFKGGKPSKPKKRWLILSKDSTYILWGTTRDYEQLNRGVPVSSIQSVIYGPYSSTFSRSITSIRGRWKCISLVVNCKNRVRTIDFQMDSESETLAWVIGISHLINVAAGISSKIRTSMINKVLDSYKWTKLRLQMEEKAYFEKQPISTLLIDAFSDVSISHN